MFRRNTIAFILVTLIVFMVGQFVKSKTLVDCGILEINNVQEYNKKEFQFDTIFNETDTDGFIKYKTEYVDDLQNADLIAIVKPTGNVKQYYAYLNQEVVIDTIIKGDKSLEGIKTNIARDGGGYSYYYLMDEMNGKQRGNNLYYMSVSNIMQPDNEYLVFFNRILLDKYVDKNSLFNLHPVLFNCIKLNSEENDYIIADITNEYKLEDLLEYEFFCTSKECLKAMYDIKREILNKYLNMYGVIKR